MLAWSFYTGVWCGTNTFIWKCGQHILAYVYDDYKSLRRKYYNVGNFHADTYCHQHAFSLSGKFIR